MDIKKIADKDSTSRRGGTKARIIVERVYNGTQDVEEVFRSINEQNAVNNIRALMNDHVKQTDHQTAQSSTKTA